MAEIENESGEEVVSECKYIYLTEKELASKSYIKIIIYLDVLVTFAGRLDISRLNVQNATNS